MQDYVAGCDLWSHALDPVQTKIARHELELPLYILNNIYILEYIICILFKNPKSVLEIGIDMCANLGCNIWTTRASVSPEYGYPGETRARVVYMASQMNVIRNSIQVILHA